MSNERDRAGAGEGPDAGADGKPHDEPADPSEATKTQDLTKAKEEGFDPNEGQL